MSVVHENMGNYGNAIECSKRSLEIKMDILGAGNEETQTTKSRLNELRSKYL
jgi:hypothetical protein